MVHYMQTTNWLVMNGNFKPRIFYMLEAKSVFYLPVIGLCEMSKLRNLSNDVLLWNKLGKDRKPLLFSLRLYNVLAKGFNSFSVLSGKLENFSLSTPSLKYNFIFIKHYHFYVTFDKLK